MTVDWDLRGPHRRLDDPHRERPRPVPADRPRRLGVRRSRACSSTPPSIAGTPPRTRVGSTARNPCFPGSAKVHTDKGLIAFSELFDRANQGEKFGVYTHDATNPDAAGRAGGDDHARGVHDHGLQRHRAPAVQQRHGASLHARPPLFTINRGYVEARQLVFADEVKLLDLPAPAVNADSVLPVSSDPDDYWTKGDHARPSASRICGPPSSPTTSAGSSATAPRQRLDRDHHLRQRRGQPRDPARATRSSRLDQRRPAAQALRAAERHGPVAVSRRAFKRFFEALGVHSVKAPEKIVPWSIEQAPDYAVSAFLQGLFDADGCAVNDTRRVH